MNDLQNFMETRESKIIFTNMVLSVTVMSIFTMLKNIFTSNYWFILTDCFPITGTLIVIFFMGIYKNEKVYQEWILEVTKIKTAFSMIGSGVVVIFITYLFKIIMQFLMITSDGPIIQYNYISRTFYGLVTSFTMYEFMTISMVLISLPLVAMIAKKINYDENVQ